MQFLGIFGKIVCWSPHFEEILVMDEHFTHDPIPILGGSFFMLIDLHILISINNAKQRRMRRIHGYDLLSEKKIFFQ